MKLKYILMAILLFIGLLAGCTSENDNQTKHAADHNHEAQITGDIREETSGKNVLPNFLANKPEDMQLIYEAVANHQFLLESMPCYCGCGESVGHRDNYDCFIHENKDNGAVVWDDHGTKCNVCLEIAAQSIVDYNKGKSIKEIRSDIEQTYEQDYAAPTPTPEI